MPTLSLFIEETFADAPVPEASLSATACNFAQAEPLSATQRRGRHLAVARATGPALPTSPTNWSSCSWRQVRRHVARESLDYRNHCICSAGASLALSLLEYTPTWLVERLLELRRKGSAQWRGCRFGWERGSCLGVEWAHFAVLGFSRPCGSVGFPDATSR